MMTSGTSEGSGEALDPRRIERVLVDALDLCDDAELIDRDDWVQLITPSRPSSRLNEVCLARLSPDGADARIAAVVQAHRERGAELMWVVGPSSTPADLSARLERAGVPVLAHVRGMHMPVPAELPALPAGLVLEPVGPAQVQRFAEINTRAWGRGPAFRRDCEDTITRVLSRPRRNQRVWLVVQDGEDIGTSVLTLLPASAPTLGYFQGAAIVPEHRRRGVYLALVRHRLAQLRSLGIEHAVVWADRSTSAGVCERAGFVTRCTAVFHELRQDEAS
jgi:N-acetylglutamate synthase-like GNAT family acetyltransferase